MSKLKTIEKKFNRPNAYQIVGMSATLSGLDTLKRWMNKTAVYECTHRPVPLTEYTLEPSSGMLYEEPPKALRLNKNEEEGKESIDIVPQRKLTDLRKLCSMTMYCENNKTKQIPLFANDKEFVIHVAAAYFRKKKAVLIFVPTKQGCQKLAEQLANQVPL